MTTQDDIDYLPPAAERYAPPRSARIPALALLCVALVAAGCALLAWAALGAVGL